jgi:hypothetical protein
VDYVKINPGELYGMMLLGLCGIIILGVVVGCNAGRRVSLNG